MFIWGWNTKAIGQSETGLTCSHCGRKGLVVITMQTFLNVFWIPTFPMRKSSSVVCSNCRTVSRPDAYRLDECHINRSQKTPWWGFSGLVLIAALLGGAAIFSVYESEQTNTYLQDLHKGDLIIVKGRINDRTAYSYLKVQDVQGETLSVYESKYAFSREGDALSEAKKAHVRRELSEESSQMSKEDLKKMNISSIKRP